MPSPPKSAIVGAGYAAFVQLYHCVYEQYACARLGDGGLGRLVVSQVLWHTEMSWSVVVSEDPVAFSWRLLRDAVTHARTRDVSVDALHRALPDRAADAALVHGRLGLPLRAAAELMGLQEGELTMDLMTARRILDRLDCQAGFSCGGCGRP